MAHGSHEHEHEDPTLLHHLGHSFVSATKDYQVHLRKPCYDFHSQIQELNTTAVRIIHRITSETNPIPKIDNDMGSLLFCTDYKSSASTRDVAGRLGVAGNSVLTVPLARARTEPLEGVAGGGPDGGRGRPAAAVCILKV